MRPLSIAWGLLAIATSCRTRVSSEPIHGRDAVPSNSATINASKDEARLLCNAVVLSGADKQSQLDDAQRLAVAFEWVEERLTRADLKKSFDFVSKPGLTAVQKTELLDDLAHREGLVGCPLADWLASGMSPRPDMSIVEGESNYYLDRTEVTVRAFGECVTAKRCTEPNAKGATGWDQFCNWKHPEGRLDHPINCVDARQAGDYCAWKGRRLPTRDEWTWAAQGGSQGNVHPWGSQPPSPAHLNMCGKECLAVLEAKLGIQWTSSYSGTDPYPATAPVGTYPPSRYRLRDLAGNVSEWTSTVDGASTVLAGVSWLHKTAEASATTTSTTLAVLRDPGVGFRCAWSATKP